jgi:hypothetical protein
MDTSDLDFLNTLSNRDIAQLFTHLLDRAIWVDPSLQYIIDDDAIVKAVCESLYKGKHHGLFTRERF